ncbi:MAG: sodium-transporting two-sector ATPase, partial [Candidatus Saccharimonadales bacterium]
AQTVRQKQLSGTLFQKVAAYNRAAEFSHFGSNLSKDSETDLRLGQQIYEVLKQTPEELYSLTEQQLALETVLLGNANLDIDVPGLKEAVKQVSRDVKEDKDFDRLEVQLLKKFGHAKPVQASPETSNATS